MDDKVVCLILMLAGFVLVHLFKMMRLYLVLMEHRLPFGKFVLLYLRTTLVNLLIPFKLGEFYRIEEVFRLTGIWQVGVLSVVVDRFFDILALFFCLLFVWIMGGVSAAVLPVFGCMILVGGLLYLSVPGSFSYLNRYLIQRRASRRSMAALRGLDVVKAWYDFTANLIRGRAVMITLTSAFGWAFEILTLTMLARYFGLPYRFEDFGRYVDAIFQAGSSMQIQEIYTRYSLMAMAGATILGYVWKLIKSLFAKQ
jgi:hypothetical protein